MTNEEVNKRLDLLEGFVEMWLGPREENYGVPQNELDALSFPELLGRFYAFLGRWPGEPFRVQNYLIDPKKISKEKIASNYNLIEFATENQGVYRWATRQQPIQEDPEVFYTDIFGEITFEIPDDWDYNSEPFPGWMSWNNNLSEFLISFILTELLFTSCTKITPAFKKYVNSSDSDLKMLSDETGTNKERFAVVDGDWLIYDRTGAGWETVACRTAEAKVNLEKFAPHESEIVKIVISFGPLLPVDVLKHRTWRITIETDGSAIVHPGPFNSAVGRLPKDTFNFDDIKKNTSTHQEKDLSHSVRLCTISHKETSASLSKEYRAKLFIEFTEAIQIAVDGHPAHLSTELPNPDDLRAHPPESLGIIPVVTNEVKQKRPHAPFSYFYGKY